MAANAGKWVARRPDMLLVTLTVALAVSGVIAVYSSSFVIALARFGDPNYYVIRHVAWALLGAVMLVLAARTDYRLWRPLALPMMLATIGALIAVVLIGQAAGGAQRWIGVGELSVQPAEFAKFTVIVYMAAWLSGKGDRIRSLEHGLVPFVIIIGIVAALIMMQPNLGTTAIILVIAFTMFWTAGAPLSHMLSLGFVGGGAIATLALAEGYRLERLSAFFNAEEDPAGTGFQTLQALIAMGNGGLTGLGLGASRSKFFYIPESHTDGVFAIIGEELGLIAALTIVVMFMLFMVRGYQIANRARDDFGALLAVGITTWIVAQALMNIGGITRVIPLAGIPLPYLSFGNNALAAVMLATGVLISVSRYARSHRASAADEKRQKKAIVRRVRE